MTQSWVTTLIGAIVVLGFFGIKLWHKESVTLEEIVAALGFFGLSAASKDVFTHSTAAEVAEATKKKMAEAVVPAQVPTEVVVVEPTVRPVSAVTDGTDGTDGTVPKTIPATKA